MNESSADCEQRIQATIISATSLQVDIKLNAVGPASCEHCQQRSGCQSLSIYHWFFEKSAISLPQPRENPYRIGDKLTVYFPKNCLQSTLLGLLGAPLSSFVLSGLFVPITGEVGAFFLGIALAVGSFFYAKQYLSKRLGTAIRFSR